MANRSFSYWFLNGNFGLELYVKPGLTANYSIALPNTAPLDGQNMRWNAAQNSLEWANPPVAGGGGTVSSIGVTVPPEMTVTPATITTSGTFAFGWASQTQNRVLAAPAAANGVPTFRTLVNDDLPSIQASKITGTLDRANIPGGTNANSFQIGNSGVTLVNDSGMLRVTSDGTQLSDITVRNLNVLGTVDTQSSTNTNIGDSSITLLSNSTGTNPTTDAFLAVKRGDLSQARVQWSEIRDKWQAGTADNMADITRSASVQITNANLTGNQYTFNHNLNLTDRDPRVIIKMNDNRDIAMSVSYGSPNSVTIDFGRAGTISGTWTITVAG